MDLGIRPVILAPMEGVTNLPFRVLCKKYGADLMFSEFISADALVRSVNRSMGKLKLLEEERPLAIQIYGKELSAMIEAARIAEEAKPDFLDLNFGCPVKKVAGKGAGAGMLRDVPKLLQITKEVVQSVKIPVTVKTRLGWNHESRIIVELAEKLQDVGIAALSIHGRTREQMYKGKADWSLISKVKNNPRMHIPIIGNGDITNSVSAKEAFEKYAVDGIMIGRAAVGRPWIFREIKHYLQSGELLPSPSVKQQLKVLKSQIDASIDWIGEKRGILHMRRHMATMFKGLSHFKQTRIDLLRADDYATLMQLLERIAEQWGSEIPSEIDLDSTFVGQKQTPEN